MRVVFVGSQKIGYKCLEKVIQIGHKIETVFTIKPDAHEKWEFNVDTLASQYNIPLFFDTEFTVDKISQIKPDVILIVGYRSIISNQILNIPTHGILGLHASLLPEYKGQAPLNWAIIKGEKKTGITLFRMNQNIDEGEIIGQKETTIGINETIIEIKERIINLALQLLEENLSLVEKGKENKVNQISKGSYGCRRIPSDSLIDWTKNSFEIYNLIRACEPSYAAYTYHKGEKIKILNAKMPEENETKYFGTSGQVGMVFKNKSVAVITGDSYLIVTKVQRENDEPIEASKILNTSRIRLQNS